MILTPPLLSRDKVSWTPAPRPRTSRAKLKSMMREAAREPIVRSLGTERQQRPAQEWQVAVDRLNHVLHTRRPWVEPEQRLPAR
jgi:hypothetical protein